MVSLSDVARFELGQVMTRGAGAESVGTSAIAAQSASSGFDASVGLVERAEAPGHFELREDPRARQVPLYITVGSPLGVRSIRDQLKPLKSPKPAKAWYNAYDERDLVALYPLDRDNFPVTPAITNDGKVKNHTDNRHGVVGYLDDPAVAKAIYDALT